MIKMFILSLSLFCFAQDLPHPSGHSTYQELKGELFTFKLTPKDKKLTLEVVGIPKLNIDFTKVDVQVKYLSQGKKPIVENIPFSQETMLIPTKPGYLPDQILIKENEKVLDTLKLKID